MSKDKPLNPLKTLPAKLLDVPEDKFLEVVRLLEQVSDNPEVRLTMQSVRPRLIQLRPARRLTLKRVFCDPFEDVLEARVTDDAPLGCISRRFIDPLWHEVAKRLPPAHKEPLERAVGTIPAHDYNARHTLGCRLWYAATLALKELIEEAHHNRRALASLGAEGLEAARDIFEFVEIGHHIVSLKNALPGKPIPSLDDESLDLISGAVREVAKIGPRKPFYLLLVLTSRMRRPAELLAALEDMDFGKGKREKMEIFTSLASLMVDGLENHSDRLEQLNQTQNRDPVATIAMAERLVESLDAAGSLMGGIGDTQYDQRLGQVRSAVRQLVQRDVLAPAASQVTAVLPAPTPGLPGWDAEENGEQQMAMEAHARALRRCESFSQSLALGPEVANTLNTIGKGVERQLTQWAQTVGQRPVAQTDTDSVEQSIYYAVRLVELTRGSGQADVLRRQALMAAFRGGDSGGNGGTGIMDLPDKDG